MSLFVIYGFDTASTLAEETKNPRVEAPKAVLASVVGAFIIGTVFLFSLIIAIPDMKKFVAGAGAVPATVTSPADVLTAVLPSWMANVYLVIVLAAIYVCCLAIQTSTIRLAFGMARDGKLPLARFYSKVSPTLHTPVIACIVVGLLAAVPFIYYAGAPLIAIAATGMIYLSYLLGNVAILIARLKGWPTENAPFKLGGWGTIVNILALVWGGSMLVNFLWLRPASNPTLNTYLNPTAAAGGAGLGGFGDTVPIFEATVAAIVIVGAIHYLVAQRGKTDQVVRAA
jgi:amino acid transporter